MLSIWENLILLSGKGLSWRREVVTNNNNVERSKLVSTCSDRNEIDEEYHFH